VAEVVAQLNVKVALFADWAKGKGLGLNGGKTQFIMSSNAGNLDGITVTVDDKEVAAMPELELLGTVMDRRFSFLPHAKATSRAARQRASVIARLSNHLPPGRYLPTLAMGLAVGKVTHALPAVIAPRLSEAAPITANSRRATQIALNNVARSVTGAKRTDLVNTTDLLSKARMTPLNTQCSRMGGMADIDPSLNA
jgi:hypothetical protein